MKRHQLRRQTGFTLIELLVVVLIIGVLIAVSAPSFLGQTQKAHDSAAKQYLTVAYRDAAAAATDYDGNFGGTVGASTAAVDHLLAAQTMACAINQAEGATYASPADCLNGATPVKSGLLFAEAGLCPTDATSDQRHIIVDETSTGGGDLTLCNDPSHTVWTLTVTDHRLVSLTSSVQPGTGVGAPRLLSAPTFSGIPQIGQTLTATTGSWANSPTGFAFQWRTSSDGGSWSNVTGATSPTYVVQPADDGRFFQVCVEASNEGGSSAAACSSASAAAVTAAIPVSSTAPVLSDPDQAGNGVDHVQFGDQLSVSTGVWTNCSAPPCSYAYTWERGVDADFSSYAVVGGNSANYTIVNADLDHYLRVAVQAHNSGGDGSAFSNQSDVVLPRTPVIQTYPLISNTTGTQSMTHVQVDDVLTTTAGQWDECTGCQFSYTWQRADDAGFSSPITVGSDASSYTILSGDQGKFLRVSVQATNSDGFAAAVFSSNQSNAVFVASPQNSAVPFVTGTPEDGQTLTGHDGTWSNAPTLSYQWQSAAAASGPWLDIPDATTSSYTLLPSDAGDYVRFEVTGTNAGGTSVADSAATDQIAASGPEVVSLTSSQSWSPPAGVSQVTVEAWGAGGGGAATSQAGGGGGGAYAKSIVDLSGTGYEVTIGNGGVAGASGGSTSFAAHIFPTVSAAGGSGGSGSGGGGGAGGSGSGATTHSGGAGGNGYSACCNTAGNAGSGGSSAGTATNGNGGGNGSAYPATLPNTTAPSGGGVGGGSCWCGAGTDGGAPGGGGGGGGANSNSSSSYAGGAGGVGKVVITPNVGSPTTYASAGTFSYSAPAGATSLTVEVWGGGGGGGGGTHSGTSSLATGAGGGGGGYAKTTSALPSSGLSLQVTVGAGGNGGNASGGSGSAGATSSVQEPNAFSSVSAGGGGFGHGGGSCASGAGGSAGTASGATTHNGGSGGNGYGTCGNTAGSGGGGGSSAGTAANGNNGGSGAQFPAGSTGGAAPTGGGAGGSDGSQGLGGNGSAPGGGGGGGDANSNAQQDYAGGAGGDGKVVITPDVGAPTTYSTPGTYFFSAPAGTSSLTVDAWGGGGGGGGGYHAGTNNLGTGGGGGGGAYAHTSFAANAGRRLIVVVGAGGSAGSSGGGNGTTGGASSVQDGGYVLAKGGASGSGAIGGAGGAAATSLGDTVFSGGSGGTSAASGGQGGGGGGSSAGSAANGSNGSANSGATGGQGGSAPTGGFAGGNGGNNGGAATGAPSFAAGGGGCGASCSGASGSGGGGLLKISYASSPTNVDLPFVFGTAQVGQTLLAGHGGWTGTAPMTFSYQWQLSSDGGTSWADIAGATGSSYTASGADAGNELRLQVTAANASASTPVAYSPAVTIS